MKRQQLVMAAALLMGSACTQETELTEQVGQVGSSRIVAYMEQMPSSRTCIPTTDISGMNTVAVLWTPGDELGVFTTAENNVKYIKANTTDNEAYAAFVNAETVTGTPQYAYYPYSESAGTDKASLSGSIPEIQTMDPATGYLPGDYKVGAYKETTAEGAEFTFKHLFCPVQIVLDGTGTDLANETIDGIDLKVTRGTEEVPVCGQFTYSAVDGSYTLGTTATEVTFDWTTDTKLSTTTYAYGTIFPTIQKDDVLTFTIRTASYTATLELTSIVNFVANSLYTFPLKLGNYKDKLVVEENITGDDNQGSTEGSGTVVATGTFTCATYNVDGLPNKISIFTVNGDGPGSGGTTNISAKITEQNWDFIGFSEDFNYHTELTSSLSNTYTFGTHRGTVTGTSNDTDGLEFATKNSTTSFANESWTAFTSSYGGLTAGANTCIDKGIRHYEVTVAEGIVVDVIITHMNTYSSSGTSHINAQHAQLKQIANYINDLVAANNRPVIFMGDTNCRYTRHDFATYFWGELTSGLTYADPWVEYQWDGVYPTYPSNSLMVSDATGTSDTDIICENTQKGEVVDKIIYINNPEASVQIKADSYLRDYDNFNGLADHMPIVAKFTWTKTAAE